MKPPINPKHLLFLTLVNNPISNKLKDESIESNKLVFTISRQASFGYATIDNVTGEWSYGPNLDFVGKDYFDIIALNEYGVPYTFTINIQVSDQNTEFTPSNLNETSTNTNNFTTSEFIAFATVPSAASYPTIPNTAYIGYSFTVVPSVTNGAFGNATSTSATTTIAYADVLTTGNFTKAVNRNYAGKGDVLAYSIIATNTGNVTANNVVITDIVPNGASYVSNSLTVNGIASTDNPNTGITLTSIPPGSSASIAYSASVNSIPPSNPLINTASIAYTYTQNPSIPNGVAAANITNAVYTTITYADLSSSGNFIKTVNTAQSTVANTISYSFFVTNTGNTTANNITIVDTLPSGITFVPGSLLVNGLPSSAGLTTGVTLPDMAPGQIIPITFNALINSLTTINPAVNTGNVTYSFTQDPSVTNGVTTSVLSNPVYTQIIPTVSVVKSATPTYLLAGDTITYTVVVNNTNSIDLNSIFFNDPLAPPLNFIPGSVLVNGVTLPFANVISGFNIGNVAANSVATIQFNAKLSATTLATVPNTSQITFSYVGTGSTTLTAQTDSNINTVNVSSINVSINKSTPLTTVTEGSYIPYTVTIQNNGQLNLYDVIFRDIFSNKISLVTPTFTVNGTLVNADMVTLQRGVDTGDLPVGAITTITFTAYCKPCCQNSASYSIVNSAYFIYNYVLPDLTGGTLYSPIVTSTVTKV